MMRSGWRLLAAAAALAPLATACGSASASTRTRTVTLVAHHSHWSLSHIDVRAGTALRIVVRNDDPIDHELIVGDAAVQDRHERGTEAKHAPRPGEISVPAGTTVETTVTFPVTGTVLYGCHLPGHWDYGMHGTITAS